MADQLDGSIKLGVELSAEDVKKSAQSLQKEIKKIFDNSAGKEVDINFKRLLTRMDQAYAKSEDLQKQMKELENVKIPTKEYEELTADIEKVGKAYERALNTQEKYTDKNKPVPESVLASVQRLAAEYENLSVEQARLENEGTAFISGEATAEYANLSNRLANVNNQMRILTAQTESVERPSEEVESIWKRIGATIYSTLSKSVSLMERFGRAVFDVAKRGLTALSNKIKETTHHSNNLGISFKTFLRYGLGIRSLFTLFNKLRNAVKEGINALAASNGGYNATNAAIHSLTDSLNYLKGAWGAAFAPIIQYVAPILVKFIDLLASAANMIGAFFAALTGKGTIVKATKQTSGLGTASGKASKAMDKENKSAEKLKSTLAGFDDLDVLDVDDNPMEDLADTLDDMGSGGAGAGVEFEEISLDQILPESLLDWIKRLKEAWANEDWHEVGMIIAEGLNAAFKVVDDWINNTLRPLGVKWAGIIAEILNGVVDGLDWELIGTTIADGFNAAFDIANTFLEKFNFENLGKGIGRALISGILQTDWELIAKTFANKWNAVMKIIKGIVETDYIWNVIGHAIANFINSWFKNVDWKGIATTAGEAVRGVFESISTAVKNIEWSNIAQTISEAFTTLLGELVIALGELDWQSIGTAIGEFIANIDWITVLALINGGLMTLVAGLFELLLSLLGTVFGEGGLADFFYSIGWDSIGGLFKGLGEALLDIATWIQENLVDPLVNGVKELLGIHSPSTVFEEIGVNIIEGLYNGITSMIDMILQAFRDLKTKLIEILEQFKTEAKTKWDLIKTTIETIVKALKLNVETLFTNLKDKAIEIWNLFKESVETLIDLFKTNVITKFNEMKTKVLEIKDKLKEEVIAKWKKIKEDVEDFVAKIKKNAEDKFDQLKTNLSTTAENMKTAVVNAWGNMWTGIKGKINTIIGGVESFANAVVDAINRVIDAINSLSINFPAFDTPFGSFGGFSLGFSLPKLGHISIPRLAQGAVIPPNKEFLAMLGDQSRGTNIEAPLDTIVDAFREVVANMQVENTGVSEMTVDGEVFARLITPYVISEMNRLGYDVTILEAGS